MLRLTFFLYSAGNDFEQAGKEKNVSEKTQLTSSSYKLPTPKYPLHVVSSIFLVFSYILAREPPDKLKALHQKGDPNASSKSKQFLGWALRFPLWSLFGENSARPVPRTLCKVWNALASQGWLQSIKPGQEGTLLPGRGWIAFFGQGGAFCRTLLIKQQLPGGDGACKPCIFQGEYSILNISKKGIFPGIKSSWHIIGHVRTICWMNDL